jgi:hypothetical protein
MVLFNKIQNEKGCLIKWIHIDHGENLKTLHLKTIVKMLE